MLKKKINSYLNNQILNLDIIQKYILKDINRIPKIEKVVVSFDLNNIKLIPLNNISEDFFYQYSTFNVYTLGCLLPIINLKKNVSITNDKNFSLKISVNNKADIENLLNNMSFDLLDKEGIVKDIKFLQSESSCSFYMPLITDLHINNTDNKAHILTNISFRFSSNTMRKNFMFRKYPFFWIF